MQPGLLTRDLATAIYRDRLDEAARRRLTHASRVDFSPRKRVFTMNLQRSFIALTAILALLLTFGAVNAQEIDPGNDGVDMDCGDFPERNAVEGYFAQDGGTAERNVDGLDPDGNGIPCDEADYDGETDGGAVDADDDGNDVVGLPTTGAGVS